MRSCCVTAAAYAVACFGKYFDDRGVVLQTENEGIAQLAQKLYARCGITGTVISKERGTGLIYEFSVKDPEQVQKMLNLFGHTGRETTLRIRPDCFKCQKCGSFFISTAFLCCGTATDPEKEYHLEFVLEDEAFAAALQRLIARFSLSAHLTKRRAMALVYLKGQSEITDMLSIFGAQSARFAMEDAYIRKELRNNANRAVNCDSANVQRAVTAASRQTEAIERVLAAKGQESLPPALRETAALRLAHPEMSLEELGRLCDPPVGKSGINHRLRKLEIMAQELDGQETAENAGEGKADGADD